MIAPACSTQVTNTETIMTINPNDIAERYIALWNERDAGARREILAEEWAADATYVDPLMAGRGAAEIDALIAGAQARFSTFSFRLTGKPDGFGENVRFSWSFGPGDFAGAPIEGTDIVVVRDGKIASVTGFVDVMPMAA
jgi:hypothetical protein